MMEDVITIKNSCHYLPHHLHEANVTVVIFFLGTMTIACHVASSASCPSPKDLMDQIHHPTPIGSLRMGLLSDLLRPLLTHPVSSWHLTPFHRFLLFFRRLLLLLFPRRHQTPFQVFGPHPRRPPRAVIMQSLHRPLNLVLCRHQIPPPSIAQHNWGYFPPGVEYICRGPPPPTCSTPGLPKPAVDHGLPQPNNTPFGII